MYHEDQLCLKHPDIPFLSHSIFCRIQLKKHIPKREYSKKITFQKSKFQKGHVPFGSHSRKSTVQKWHIPYRSHSKKGKFHFGHIQKRAHSKKDTFHLYHILKKHISESDYSFLITNQTGNIQKRASFRSCW